MIALLTPAGHKALQQLKRQLDRYLNAHCPFCGTKLTNGQCLACKYHEHNIPNTPTKQR